MQGALRENRSRAVGALILVVLVALAVALASLDRDRDGGVADAVASGPFPPALTVPDGWVADLTLERSEAVVGDLRRVPARGAGERPGRYALRARYHGGGRNGYSRVVLPVQWRPGDEVRYGASFLLPDGFTAAMQGEVDLLRFDNYPLDPAHNDRGGVVIYQGDRMARLVRHRLGRPQVILGSPFSLPEDRWFRLEVRQRLSRGSTLNQVYVDGVRVAQSTDANSYGRRITRLRAGLVAVASGLQRRPLRLYFDAPYARVRSRD